MKERIKKIMDNENLSAGVFAESIGIQRSALSHILNGRNNPSLDVVMKIHQRFNYINLDWLLYGTGQMSNQEIVRDEYQPSLFDENPVNTSKSPIGTEYRKEIASITLENSHKVPVKEEIRYIERPPRKITEIRIFFDDNTFEIFKGEK